MTPAVEEAHRLLRMAQGDRDAFLVLKTASGIRSSIVCFHAQRYDDIEFATIPYEEVGRMVGRILAWVADLLRNL